MRWPIIRLIWLRELRDQLRDRRTLFMIAVLPLLLYPLGGIGLAQLAFPFLARKNTVRIVGYKDLPSPRFGRADAAASWLAITPLGLGGPMANVERFASALSLWRSRLEYPALLDLSGQRPAFLPNYYEGGTDNNFFTVELADYPADIRPDNESLKAYYKTDFETRKVDLIVVVPPRFGERLAAGERPPLHILQHDGDERSRLAYNRFSGVLKQWKAALKETRLSRQGLPADFDEPFRQRDSVEGKTTGALASGELAKILSQIFPFVLVMWSLAGALYPAVDLCAGEKERGTMETLLISPASREEIVWGKFLTIWVFSAATALLNLLSMGLTAWFLTSGLRDLVAFHLSYLFWAALLLLPLSAFFSAMCLSVGVYARSSKEGQYYLMPLFLLTMPLVFLTLVPGVELNHFYSMVPVTGVALLLQELMKTGNDTRSLGMYFVPVLAPTVIYSWLALRWAIEQFQREEVLFREAERLDLGLWLKRLFREKGLLPSTGQALFCFLVVLVLHWVTLSAFVPGRDRWTLLVVGYFATLALPLLMALLLTRRPALALGLRPPPAWGWPVAALLGLLLFLPGVELTYIILNQFPAIRDSLTYSQPHLRDAGSVAGTQVSWTAVVIAALGLALAQAVFEELTFRGFVLTGLRKRFRPGTAIFLSAFLFAVFQMNVFQCVPHFAMGAVLGFVAWRTGSVFPAIVLHFVYNVPLYVLMIGASARPELLKPFTDPDGNLSPLALTLGAVSAVLAAGVLAGASLLRKRPDAVEALAAPTETPALHKRLDAVGELAAAETKEL
jgi:sodium transport system permease protein